MQISWLFTNLSDFKLFADLKSSVHADHKYTYEYLAIICFSHATCMQQCPVYLAANSSDFSFEQFLANFSVVTHLILMPFGKSGQTVDIYSPSEAEPIRSTQRLASLGTNTSA